MHLASRMNDPRVIKQYHQLSFTSSSDSGIDFHVLTIVPSSIPLYILCIVDQNATSSWKGYFFIWEQRENKEGKIGAHEVGVSSIRCLNCDGFSVILPGPVICHIGLSKWAFLDLEADHHPVRILCVAFNLGSDSRSRSVSPEKKARYLVRFECITD